MIDPYDGPRKKKKRMYFGHPINTYDTPLEARLVAALEAAFPDYEIENPNKPEHQAGYAEWEKTHVDADGKPTGMGYFFEVVLPTCDAGAHLAWPDKMFGKGVFGEADWQQERGQPTWEIFPDATIATLPPPLDKARCLTREETAARLWDEPEKVSTEKVPFKPYQ